MPRESTYVPRPEYPRPQLVRDKWINLNGYWEFEIDNGKSGRERSLHEAKELGGKILVPFCPESKLSEVENKDFMAAVWYRREVIIPEEWKNQRVILHFGAVDYYTEAWVNGISVGKHKGGYSSFSFDITDSLKEGVNTIIVCAEDDVRSWLQPRGKQSSEYHSHGCEYTRTTGIWQTVWLECVPQEYIVSVKYTPDPANSYLHIEAVLNKSLCGYKLSAEAFHQGAKVGRSDIFVTGNSVRLSLKLSEVHLWDVGKPELYDLHISLSNNEQCIDKIKSYFGLRIISFDNNAISINARKVFQRLVLDQGFYTDGIYTAPSEEDLKKDIQIALDMGFNGARLHEKIFEPRLLYWADKMGYIVWGEHANWGLDISTSTGLESFLPEWIEAVERDYNHPSIVGWCPFNETWDIKGSSITGGIRQNDEVLRIVYNVTKAIDKTRPVIDTSGNFHVVTDIFDIHDYEQNPEVFAAKFEPMKNGGEAYIGWHGRQKYEGQPYFVSEYGGIWWSEDLEKGWGYGNRPSSEEEFIERYRGLTEALLKHPKICAFCYTQLYDVEQEVNGLYTYERKAKFDPEIIKAINMQKAAIEE
jgi:beta-galactosidase/beta-glucuronidase